MRYKFNIENSGTYKIINTLNNKYYPGSTKNFLNRKKRHFWMLRSNKHHCQHLQNAYNLAEDKSIFMFVVQKNNIPIDQLKKKNKFF